MSDDSWLESNYDDRNGALVDSDDPPEGWGWLPCDGTADCEADLHEAPCASLTRFDHNGLDNSNQPACTGCGADAGKSCRESCVGLAVYLGQIHD